MSSHLALVVQSLPSGIGVYDRNQKRIPLLHAADVRSSETPKYWYVPSIHRWHLLQNCASHKIKRGVTDLGRQRQ